MIDKLLPSYPLTLYKTDTEQYPKYGLPEGYTFVFYQPGDEEAWARLECSLGQFDSMEKGLECFKREFLVDQILVPEERMLFVRDASGEYVATATLWDGMYLGKRCQRVHWVAVSDRCKGKGIAKALLSRVLDLYHELGYSGFIYLLTGTRYYPAIGIYKSFGFTEYRGERSLSDSMTDEEFQEQNERAIAFVQEKLKEYTHQKGGT
ncbi:MAG: GNAT family N-acetyltransferase [Clostridia bacterium]|nr:GNAT family N-acetyltransferase [Clostridia bacterium]